MKIYIITILLIWQALTVFGQEAKITGDIRDESGEPMVKVIVFQENTGNSTYSDINGHYELPIHAGSSVIVFSMMGYVKQRVALNIESNGTQVIDVTLKEDTKTLDDIEILGKSEVRRVMETGFNVVAINAKPYHNATVSLSQVLDRTPGVKIQQEGGLGSATNTTINGLSGRHVRFFIDGMPMDAMSSAFQINNLPVNMAERIEVYKGVVPVDFGSDALGGAVNIVTTKTPGRYLDFSYSYGSFNTHQTFLNTGITTDAGFTLQISAFQNYSDNNYFVDVNVRDFETNLYSQKKYHVRRFHDVYHNETIIAKAGLVNKKYADQLLVGFTLGQEYDEIQHAAYMNAVYGEKYQTSNTIMPSFLYSKDDLFTKNLNVKLAANYNLGEGHSYDLSDKEYNWLGEWQYSNNLGEYEYTDYVYNNNNGTINARANYEVNDKHRITVNDVMTFYAREGDDKVNDDDYMNEKPMVDNRNILGMSWNTNWNDRLSTSVFGKRYSYYASAYLNLSNTNGEEDWQTESKSGSKYGYGLTATYFLKENFQLKGNLEQTCRMPVSSELFGEVFGFYLANFDLKPERSQNYNIGFNYTYNEKRYSVINVDFNLFYRRTDDYIRRNISYSQGEASYENTQLVKTVGVDAEIRYSLRDKFTCGGNISWQDPRNKSEDEITLYDAVMPNLANVFGNADASYIFKNVGLPESRLSLGYNVQYLNSFLYDYSTYQASNRAEVPSQWSHNFQVIYSWQNGKYNVSLDGRNLFDAKLYDNYNLQKPGRSFSVKFRYFINKV